MSRIPLPRKLDRRRVSLLLVDPFRVSFRRSASRSARLANHDPIFRRTVTLRCYGVCTRLCALFVRRSFELSQHCRDLICRSIADNRRGFERGEDGDGNEASFVQYLF